jgi:hypothetical protein
VKWIDTAAMGSCNNKAKQNSILCHGLVATKLKNNYYVYAHNCNIYECMGWTLIKNSQISPNCHWF